MISEIANNLAALLDQSLLLRKDDATKSRFIMLETIREFALDHFLPPAIWM